MRLRNLLQSTLLLICTILPCEAKIKGQKVCADIYTHTDSERAADSLRMIVPKRHEKATVVDHAYTKAAERGQTYEGKDIDSLALWMPTKPEYRHILVYLEPYGWCWRLEHTPAASVYAYCKDGYRLSGNGGMTTRGKFMILVAAKGKITEFKNTHKMADDKFRSQIAGIVADDPVLRNEILNSRTRRDKTLRMLRHYIPTRDL